MEQITVGIPAYKAEKHILDAISSIQIQTERPRVIVASDNPSDDYSFLLDRFPDLNIKILPCEKNGGPGLARQRALDACETEWITFMDADDVLSSPFSLEALYRPMRNDPTIIEVAGQFVQEVDKNSPSGMRQILHAGAKEPWVFGKLYKVSYLRTNKITFSDLRAMEDGEFNWKIEMLSAGSGYKIMVVQEQVYLWRMGSEHSITRIGMDNEGIPQYNFDLCPYGAIEATIRAVTFCKKMNPFNGEINKFILTMMINSYFTYIECLSRKEIFAEQNFFNAKKLYHELYKGISDEIDDKVLADFYTVALSEKAKELIGIIPKITFFKFMDKLKNEPYGGEEEFKKIRESLPQEIIDNDLKSGVFGEKIY